jgi:hypothetical protein
MLDKYSLAKKYYDENDIAPELKRIAQGNYFGQNVNISQMYAGHISTIKNTSLNLNLLKHFMDSYEFSIKAFQANPEWLEYREGQEAMKRNIESIIESNKSNWHNCLLEFNSNPLLIKIMKSQDIQAYKKANAKIEIESDYLKKFYFTGIFWLIALGVVVFIVYSIFDSSIPVLYKPLAVFLIIVLFSIVGAFILRTNEDLSEEGFLELMKLSLKIGFKGLKTLDNKESA